MDIATALQKQAASFKPFARVLVITSGKVDEYVFCGNPRERIEKVSQEGRDKHDLHLGRKIMDWITENAPIRSE